MKLPYRKNAFVFNKKLKDYLLSDTHPVGKFKSKYFKSLGFTKDKLDELKVVILKIAQTNDVVEVTTSAYGKKYVIDGYINGKTRLRTVWIIEKDSKQPRFVTAYPV